MIMSFSLFSACDIAFTVAANENPSRLRASLGGSSSSVSTANEEEDAKTLAPDRMTTLQQQQERERLPGSAAAETEQDGPEEEIASLSSTASPEGATPPQPMYYESSSLSGSATTRPADPLARGEMDESGARKHRTSGVSSKAEQLLGDPPRNLKEFDSSLSDELGLKADSEVTPALGGASSSKVYEVPLGSPSSLSDSAELLASALETSRRVEGGYSVVPLALNHDNDDDVVVDEHQCRPLTEEEEGTLLAAYESSSSQLRQQLSGVVGAEHGNEDDSIGDPPLTMEDTDSDPETLSPGLVVPVNEEMKGGSVVLDATSQSQKLLAEYESKVVLGSDAMLHHRRLPSTIYEEMSEATPLMEAKRMRALDTPDLLPRIASSALNLTELDDAEDVSHDRSGFSNTASWQQQQPVIDPTRETLRGADTSPGSTPVLPRLASFGSLPSLGTLPSSTLLRPKPERKADGPFQPSIASARMYQAISARLLRKHAAYAATWIGFWALFHITCVNYVLTPLRDAIAIKVGVKHIPMLTLASTGLAFVSSVPIGWLFEAPDPSRRKLWKRMGLTRGETQGTSLALFYRCFAVVLISYAVGFTGVEWLIARRSDSGSSSQSNEPGLTSSWIAVASGKAVYVAFFLVVHLMKLHSLSLVWGVTTEAMEYEEVARRNEQAETSQTRLQRLSLVGFGGTLGGIVGSGLASSMAQILKLPGLLILAAILLEIGAELSIELGRIMQKHWETQQLFQSSNDLASLDASMRRSASLGSMKRVASGNSLSRVKSTSDLAKGGIPANNLELNDGTFAQRLLRGVTTILRSRLLMAIFTYNALYASTTVLLSFQRAELVANRNKATSAEADTAFLANINMASSIAIFALQASGLGAMVAHKCGPRGTLSLMPLIRLAGVLSLAWWHRISTGQPPNLLVFLVVDECCKIMNLAVAKPVRESLWRGLSNEARYESKPIVDTLANRWGGGSAAFLVSFIHHTLDWFGYGVDTGSTQSHERAIFGFPPVLFLCMVISAWWTVVSADLGQIRSRIDIELKKRQ